MLAKAKGYIRHQIRKYPHIRSCMTVLKRRFADKNSADHYLADTRQILNKIDLDTTPKKLAQPRSALIEITNACNLNCLMCSTQLSERDAGIMSPEVFKRIVEELKVVGISSAGLHTVGETFVYKDLETLFAIAEKLDFRIWISTNAQFPERIEPLYDRFPKVFNDIRISIDGATRETFEHIRVGGSFDKVVETLDVVHKINRGKLDSHIGITIDSVLNLETVGESQLLFKTFKKYVFPENMNFSVITGLSPDDEYFKNTFPYKHLVRSAVPCSMPFTSQYFTFDGQATMCCRDYNAEITVGDIMTQTSTEIWNGSKSEAVRAQHLDPEKLRIDSCKNCFMPYDFVTPITNNFIHLARLRLDDSEKSKFGSSISTLWKGMDNAMSRRDIFELREFVNYAFQEVASGRFLISSQKN